jgi:hypothetical protein
MKLIIFFLLISFSATAQLAIINDPDGFTNVRADKNTQAKILGRLLNDDVFLFDIEGNDQWAYVAKGEQLQGYIHKSRLLPIDSLPHIPVSNAFRVQKGNELTIHNDSISFQMKVSAFVIAKHKIQKDASGFVNKIDGAVPRGVDGNLPKNQLVEIKLSVHDNIISIPAAAYTDLFEPGIDSFNIYFDKKGKIYLYMASSSDGAGFYSVVWVIKNGQYLKRYIDAL